MEDNKMDNQNIVLTQEQLQDIIKKATAEALKENAVIKQEVKTEDKKDIFTENLAKMEAERKLKEQAKRELELEDKFNSFDAGFTEDEKRAFVGVPSEDIKLMTMERIIGDEELRQFINKKDLKKIDDILKNSSKEDKLKFLLDYTEIVAEATERMELVKIENEKKFGAELSKMNYAPTTKQTFKKEDIRNNDVRRVFEDLFK
jgi:hypothetical protein